MSARESEIAKFERLAGLWWDPLGPMRPLHVMNSLRHGWLERLFDGHFGAERNGLRVLDAGCGAGLLCERLASNGCRVTGVDAAERNILIARRHAAASGLSIDYRHGEPADALLADERFDVVLALEVVEHVEDVPRFLATLAARVEPDGLLVVSTLNRTWRSFLVAILGAEYVFRVLPRGTHEWRRFLRPVEVESALRPFGMTRVAHSGMRYLPVVHRAWWTRDDAVNYVSAFMAPGLAAAPPQRLPRRALA